MENFARLSWRVDTRRLKFLSLVFPSGGKVNEDVRVDGSGKLHGRRGASHKKARGRVGVWLYKCWRRAGQHQDYGGRTVGEGAAIAHIVIIIAVPRLLANQHDHRHTDHECLCVNFHYFEYEVVVSNCSL